MPYNFIKVDESLSHAKRLQRLQEVIWDETAGQFVGGDREAVLNEECKDSQQVGGTRSIAGGRRPSLTTLGAAQFQRRTMQMWLYICYWTLYFLGWFGVPFIQGVIQSAEFTFR
jgi:hypothetical protein